jgi:hypothetical protein
MGSNQQRGQPSAAGFALVTVILVLAALLLLCTPFLLSATNADQASQQLFSRTEAGIALDNASVHARARLERSHPSLDSSFHSDSLDELLVGGALRADFLDPHNAQGVMWDAFATDVAGQVDLGSAPPQVLAAMMSMVSRISKPLLKDEVELTLASVEGLDPQGYLWVGGELVKYAKIEGNLVTGAQRGYGANYDADDNPLPGPLPPTDHGVGTIVLDYRGFAPVEWRGLNGDVRAFDSYERLEEVNRYTFPEAQLRTQHFADLMRLGNVFGGVGAGAKWQRAARMTSSGKADVQGDIHVDSVRWFNEGSTIQIRSRDYAELAVIRNVSGSGTIYLDRALSGNYDAYEAEVRVLSRRPVNVNTASPAVIEVLLDGLKLRNRNQRITGSEARALSQLIVESRPFEGLEDFMRRIVLPAAGIEELPQDAPIVPDVFAAGRGGEAGSGGVIDADDAVALYRNALNANDYQLEFSTMPFCFTTNDVYDLLLRTVVNAASGVERCSAEREETRVVVPQRELQHVWGHQEDFDMMLRLGREAPYWMTGPKPTSRHDGLRSQPPTRMWSHLGTYEGNLYLPGVVNNTGLIFSGDVPSPEHVFAEREEDGFAQLFHYQVDDSADPEWRGRMEHFTHETRSLEGRYLPDQTIVHVPSDPQVQWDRQNGVGFLRGFEFSFWVMPRVHADSVLLDVGGSSLYADRVSVLMEGGDLVLRALDGGGDHRDTAGFKEASELRYSLTPDGKSSGLPLDTWNHIEVDVRGTRPSQMLMLVNGLASGVRTLGLTRLSSQIDEFTSSLQVESTEGFPDLGVVRIGDELIEYRKVGGVLQATYVESGGDAGFGGRNARVQWSGGQPAGPMNIGLTALNHPAGATVELYGFANVLASDVPAGQSALPVQLGMFRVATVSAVEGTAPQGEQIDVLGFPVAFPVGNGIKAVGTQVTGLVLGSAETPDDQNADIAAVMAAFNTGGGYAALLQVHAGDTLDGYPIGGWSVIRYSGWQGNTLQVAAWGDQVPELVNLQNADPDEGGGARAFVVQWTALTGGMPIQQIHWARLFVIPISLPAPGSPASFLPASAAVPQFAQITEASAGEKTEWVCYNEVISGATLQLVRDDPAALQEAQERAVGTRPPVDPDDPGPGPQPPGNFSAPPSPPSPPSAAVATSPLLGSQWQPILGEEQDKDYPITRAVREAFQFRGVLGTFSHSHAAGTPILPAFRLSDGGVDRGRCGKHDPVFLMSSDFNSIGWPLTVYRAHKPSLAHIVHLWAPTPNDLIAVDSGETPFVETVGSVGSADWFCTLSTASPAPVLAGSVQGGTGFNIVDTRAIGRVTRFPSGERPRNATSLNVGGAYNGGSVPAATVDELRYGATDFGLKTPLVDPESIQAAQLLMTDNLPDSNGREIIHVWDAAVRIPWGVFNSTYKYLTDLDQEGGLLRLGNEILAYESLDINLGEISVAQGGRGLLGTLEGQHERGSSVTFLDGFKVAILAGSIGAGDATIPVTSTADFPLEGTLLIGRELVHYTRLRQGAFEMPRASSEAGRMDEKGGGLFRGRFGTQPEVHQAGEPVILFPFRYWDRWAPRADGPELAYFGLELDQPAAFWRSFFWQEEEAAHPGVRLGVLMRSDPRVPWDADPEQTEGLALFYRSEEGTTTKPILTQSDSVEWRFFIEYSSGAFDADTGAGHAWRATPLLQNVLVEYLGPSMTLRSVER